MQYLIVKTTLQLTARKEDPRVTEAQVRLVRCIQSQFNDRIEGLPSKHANFTSIDVTILNLMHFIGFQ